MKRIILVLALLALLLVACNPAQTPVPVSLTPAGKCGDGICSGPENTQNCPADCTASTGAAVSGSDSTPAPVSSSQGDAPMYMTTMTHMEGNFIDDRDEGVFLRHVEELRYGMNLADEYDAILTIESEKPFASANTKWDLNIMAEIQARGHGVGTHCDIGFKEPPMPVEDFAAMFMENKSLVDMLIGAENNLGCSGGGSVNDWALAASMAGFKYLDGIVSMHYLSMPLANRPDSTWTDDFIRNGHFHLNAPADLYQRIYPFGVANAQDFVADENPVIVVSSGELGLISALAEGGREPGAIPLPDEEYAFNNADVDTLVAKILEINQSRDRSRIAKLCVYIPANMYDPQNESVLRYFFSQMQTLQNQGVITWATQRQVYEAYETWNK